MKRCTNKKTFDFFKLFERFIQDSKRGKRLQPDGRKLSEGSIVSYKYVERILKRFSEERKFPLQIRSVRKLTSRQMIVERNYWRKFYKNFTEYMYSSCGYYDNYVGHNIKTLRVFFNYLNKDLLLNVGDFHKSFYVRKENIPIIALLPEELNLLIYDMDFENTLSSKLQKVKDVFVFGCTVALRYSDLVNLEWRNIRIVNNEWYLQVRSQKTTTDTRIKLPEYAITIIKRYRNCRCKKLLPRFSKVNLNKNVKELCYKAGFTQPVSKSRERRGKQFELRKKATSDTDKFIFCDLVTTHTMRRTAITTMLCLGMPEHIVRKISGHAPGSKEFYRYVSLAQGYQDKETETMFEKLKERAQERIKISA